MPNIVYIVHLLPLTVINFLSKLFHIKHHVLLYKLLAPTTRLVKFLL